MLKDCADTERTLRRDITIRDGIAYSGSCGGQPEGGGGWNISEAGTAASD